MKTVFAQKAHTYAAAVRHKFTILDRCLEFMDGKVTGIARPRASDEQNKAYNGHKRKHALKYQTVTTSDSLIIYAYSPMAGSRHDCALCIRSNIKK